MCSSFNKKETLNKYFELLMKEYTTSTDYLEQVVKKTSKTIANLEQNNDNMSYMKNCDNAIDNMFKLTDILRRFNNQLENNCSDFEDIEASTVIYTPPDISKFNFTKTIECIITHITPDGDFYVTELNSENASAIIKIQESLTNQPMKLRNIPNEVFGIAINDNFYRAVKIESLDCKNNLFLLDVGENYSITECSMDIYQLSDECKKLPAQAILCKMETKDATTYIQNNLYLKNQFIVESVKLGVIYLKPITNPFSISFQTVTKYDTGCTYDTNPFKQKMNLTDNDCVGIDNNHLNKPYELTDKQMKELFEEPEMQTENASKAITYYEATDEQRYCRFYDPETNGCFKGNKCLLLHAPPLEGGYTRDEGRVQLNVSNLEYPDVGSEVKVFVTHVEDVENIYAHFLPFNSITLKQSNLKELTLKMNASETVCKYRKIKHIPAIHELIIALYKDRHWYRARIINVIDDESVQVLYVDYGNCLLISLEDVREWSPSFNYLPFQAVKLHIDNVLRIKTDHSESIAFLKRLIYNKTILAMIIDISENITVLLRDTSGNDIAKKLVDANMAKFKNSIE